MADSSITVSALTASPGIGHVALQWSFSDPHTPGGLPQLQLAAVELWASTTNDRDATAAKVAEGRDNALHPALTEGATWYYWIKARDNAGQYGDWYPAGATAGVQVTVGFAASAGFTLINGNIVASIAGNALTIAVKTISGEDPDADNPVTLAFRSSTTTSSALVFRQITSALSLTISSGSTLGTFNGIPFRLWVALFDDGGTLRLAAINCLVSGIAIVAIPEDRLASATAEGGAGGADTAGIFYAAAAISVMPFRVVAYLEWSTGLATVGTWSDGPTIVAMVGPATKRPGDVAQTSTNLAPGYLSGVANIPFDNTAPDDTEGTTGVAASITPISAANQLLVRFNNTLARSTAGPVIAFVFKSGVTDALCTVTQNAGADAPMTLSAELVIQAGNTSLQTFISNVGATGGATLYRNGNSGGQLFGGTLSSNMSILELVA